MTLASRPPTDSPGTAVAVGMRGPASALTLPMRRASVARAHDALLGGHDHYPADRSALTRLHRVYPGYREALLASRRFIRTALERLTRDGIGQFLDLSDGLPTRRSVPDLVRSVTATARLLRVGDDPTAYTHGVIAAARLGMSTVRHDISDVPGLLTRPETTRTLDLTRPVGVLCTEILHLLDDDRAHDLLDGLHRGLPPGSQLAVTIMGVGTRTAVDRHAATSRDLETRLGRPLVLRTRTQAADLVAGLPTAPPGLADLDPRPSSATPTGHLTTLSGLVPRYGADRHHDRGTPDPARGVTT